MQINPTPAHYVPCHAARASSSQRQLSASSLPKWRLWRGLLKRLLSTMTPRPDWSVPVTLDASTPDWARRVLASNDRGRPWRVRLHEI